MLDVLPYGGLILGIVSLYAGNSKKLQLSLIIGAMLLAGATHTITIVGGAFTFIFMGICWLYFKGPENGCRKGLAYGMLVGMGIGFTLHWIPGFNNLLIFKDVQLSLLSSPFNLYLSFDKGIMALVLAFFIGIGLKNNQQFPVWNKHVLIALFGSITIISCLGLLSGYIAFDPKFSPLFFSWGMGNLFFACFAEEVLFRGFIQKSFVDFFAKYQIGFLFPLFFTSLIFGLIHLQRRPGVYWIGHTCWIVLRICVSHNKNG